MSQLVGKKAPDFKMEAAYKGDLTTVSLSDYKGKWIVMFFYPLDFTFVCPTEIVAFSDKAEEFKKLGAEILGVSVDSKFSHLTWTNTDRKAGGVGHLEYPLAADLNKQVARDYGVLMEEAGVALRGLFIIDDEGIVQYEVCHNLGVGRCVEETLRVLQGFQTVKKTGEVCPANWTPEHDTMKPDPKGSRSYFAKHG